MVAAKRKRGAHPAASERASLEAGPAPPSPATTALPQAAVASSADPSSAPDQPEAGPSSPMAPKKPARTRPADRAPFFTGAAIHKALSTASADSLRQALQQLRIQTNLTFAEQSNPTSIPPTDPRIKVVQEYCQLCEDEAAVQASATITSASPSAGAASSIFAAWELAEKQSLGPLLPLPIFVLAHILPLLSAHFPTQNLGENIIHRLISLGEPWFDHLQKYISNSTGTGPKNGKARDQGNLNSDVAVLASLLLLKEMVSFGRGRFASRVFARFNWALKSLPKLLNRRRRRFADKDAGSKNDKGKSRAKPSEPSDHGATSLERPDIRTLYILFLLSFLTQTYSSSLKVQLLDLGREHLPQMLKGLIYDPPDVVHHILVTMHEDFIRDNKVPRARKASFWNEFGCACVIKLYEREHERVVVEEDGNLVQGSSVAELAHHFLLSISTHTGFGICYSDRGWYPRPSAATGMDDDGGLNDLDQERMAEEAEEDETEGAFARIGGKIRKARPRNIYNKALSGVLPRLSVTEDLLQQELALGILRACPELVGPYLEGACGGLTLEPRSSSRWLCNAAFLGRVMELELPSFRNARLERKFDDADPQRASSFYTSFAAHPPPLSTILSNILPSPLSRQLFTRGVHNPDRLVRHTTASILCRCLERLSRFREVCEKASLELDESDSGPWRVRARTLEIEARKRLPEISVVIQMMQDLTAPAGTGPTRGITPSKTAINGREDGHVAEDEAPETPPASPSSNVLLVEASLRLLWLYYLAMPSSALDSRFDVGKLLTHPFMSPLRRATLDEDGEPEKLNLQALCQVHALRIVSLSTELSFDWTAKAAGGGGNGAKSPAKSYLGLLLTIYSTTPLDQIRESCEALFDRLIAPSNLFEHDPRELGAWLESLPSTDANTSVIAVTTADEHADEDERDGAAQRGTDEAELLNPDQVYVLGFVDECAQRCMKTPYRYIESSRQYLYDSLLHAASGVQAKEEEAETPAVSSHDTIDLVASPLLMTLLEQFTIRARKGLFERAELVDAMLSFFNRLLPSLVGCGRSLAALDRMARQIVESVEANNQSRTSASQFLCKTLLASIASFRAAPAAVVESDDAMEDVDLFLDITSPTELRDRLRSASRPLSRGQVLNLYRRALAFKEAGHSRSLQILDELHAAEENLAVALGSDYAAAKPGRLPLLHLPANQNLEEEPDVDPFVDADEIELGDIEAWASPVQAKLAAAMAIERLSSQTSRAMGDTGQQLPQTVSILRRVVASAVLDEVELERLIFAKPSLVLCLSPANTQASPALLLEMADVVSQVLDPSSGVHRRLVGPIAAALVRSLVTTHVDPQQTLTAFLRLAPFSDDELLLRATQLLLQSLEDPTRQQATLPESIRLTLEVLNVCIGLATSELVEQSLVAKIDVLSHLIARLGDDTETATLVINLLDHALAARDSTSARSRAVADVQASPAAFDIEQLVRLDSLNSADGLVFKAVLGSTSNASAVASILSQTIIGNDPEKAKAKIRRQLSTFRASLYVLLHTGTGDQYWNEGVLSRLGNMVCEVIVEQRSAKKPAVGRRQHPDAMPLCACLDLLLRIAAKMGLKTASDTISRAILEVVQQAQPRDAFEDGLLALAASMLPKHAGSATAEEAHKATVQAMLDKGLLWLVRRFAEDENDHIELIDQVRTFIHLVEDATECQAAVPKAHLAEPVIEAALRHRMLSEAPMKLVLVLCRTCALKTTQLARYLSSVTSHSEFGAIVNGTAIPLPPVAGDAGLDALVGSADQDGEEAKARLEADQHELRLTVVQVIHAIVLRDAKGLCSPSLMTKLLGVYGGSLSRSDRCLLDLFRLFEEECGSSFLSLARHWAAPSAGVTADALSSQQRVIEALLSIDANAAFATCTEYPRCIPLRRSARSGYATDVDQQAIGHSDPASRYDPVFLAALLAGSLAEARINGFEWLQILRTNVLGVVVCGLSSRCGDMRKGSLEILGKCYASVAAAGFAQRDYVILALDLLRSCIPKAAFDDAQRGWEAPPALPLTTTLFVAHTLRSIAYPALFTFPLFQRFLLQRPTLDATDVPMLYSLLYSSTDQHRQERIWMLRFLRDVARAGGKAEWKVWRRRHVWELLTSLYDGVVDGVGAGLPVSALPGRTGGGAGKEPEDEAVIKALIEDTLVWLARIPAVATDLVSRRGVLSWIAGKIQRASSSNAATSAAAAGHPGSIDDHRPHRPGEPHDAAPSAPHEDRTVWLGIVQQLLTHADLERWDRASAGTWPSAVLSIVATAQPSPPSGGIEDSADAARRRLLLSTSAAVVGKAVGYVSRRYQSDGESSTEHVPNGDRYIVHRPLLAVLRSLTVQVEPWFEAVSRHDAPPDSPDGKRRDRDRQLEKTVDRLYLAALGLWWTARGERKRAGRAESDLFQRVVRMAVKSQTNEDAKELALQVSFNGAR